MVIKLLSKPFRVLNSQVNFGIICKTKENDSNYENLTVSKGLN